MHLPLSRVRQLAHAAHGRGQGFEALQKPWTRTGAVNVSQMRSARQHTGNKIVCAQVSGSQAGLSVKKKQGPVTQEASNTFLAKVKAAWQIFFPPKPETVSPREAGKSRLRMILVADRCGLNQASMHEMRHSIVRAVSDYVEIEAEDMVDVNVSSHPDMGTVYSVAVPVRRVRPQARAGSLLDGEMEADGVTLMWDDDPEDRFPYGC